MLQQQSEILYLQGIPAGGATANGNGDSVLTAGFNGTIMLEVAESAGGTCTLALQGSFDGGANWYAVGYQQVDNTASPSRAVANLSVTASMKHVYQVLDAYPQLRAVMSSVAGGCTLTVRAYCVPV